MRLERRVDTPLWLMAAAPLVAIIAALLLCGALISMAGVNPVTAYAEVLKGAFGSRLSLTETFARATPLILTGLAAAVAFRARLWNIGGEGQFYLGALVTAWLGFELLLRLPVPIAMILMMLAGALVGALWLIGPVWMRLKLGVDEVVTTLIGNFIVILFIGLMIEGPLRDPLAFGWPQSVPVDRSLMLPDLVPRSSLHVGLLVAVATAVAVWLVQGRTVFGLESRAAGLSPGAASFAGVPLSRTLLLVALLSGGLAGLAGAVQVMGVTGYVTTTLSPGFGYAGIVVAMLAALNPLGVVAAAIFISSIFVGADAMSRATGVPSAIADVITAVSLLCMLVALLFTTYRLRR